MEIINPMLLDRLRDWIFIALKYVQVLARAYIAVSRRRIVWVRTVKVFDRFRTNRRRNALVDIVQLSLQVGWKFRAIEIRFHESLRWILGILISG